MAVEVRQPPSIVGAAVRPARQRPTWLPLMAMFLAGAAVGATLLQFAPWTGASAPPVGPTVPPSATPTPTAPSTAPTSPATGLPSPAQQTADLILARAQADDIAGLAELALAGGSGFTASFGDEATTTDDVVALWEALGREAVTDAILAIVPLADWYPTEGRDPSGTAVTIYVTPRFMHEPTAANRAALEARLGSDAVATGITDGQWLGWRLGITAQGDWQFLVVGD